MVLLLDERTVGELLSPADALTCVSESFRLLGEGLAFNEPRHRSQTDGVTLNVMWAMAPPLDAVAVKSYPVVRTDVSQAAVIMLTLFSHTSGECIAIVQADLLGQRRTAAATALATRLCARPDSRVLTLFGTGYQAYAQAGAVAAVLPELSQINIVGRTPSKVQDFVSRVSASLPHLDVAAPGAERAVRLADVVVTATGATQPLFDGNWIKPGTHINAIGSNQAHNRELDRTTMLRADRITVDSRAVAARECGDLLANGLDAATTIDLSDVLAGRVDGRQGDSEITLFESHGLALQDLVSGIHVVRAAKKAGLGTDTDFIQLASAAAVE